MLIVPLHERDQLFYVYAPENTPEIAEPQFGIIAPNERQEGLGTTQPEPLKGISSSGYFLAYTQIVMSSYLEEEALPQQHNQRAYLTNLHMMVVHHSGQTNLNTLNELSADRQKELLQFWQELHPQQHLPMSLKKIADRLAENNQMQPMLRRKSKKLRTLER